MIINLTTLPTAGGGAAFASITPAGTLLLEEAPSEATAASGATLLTSLANDFPVLGDLLVTNTPAPTTPSLGQTRVYVDSALKQLSTIDDSGLVTNLTGGAVSMGQLPAAVKTSSFEFILDGAGGSLLTGLQGWIEVPFNCTITQVTLLADVSGSVTIDLWRCTYANYAPPTHPVVGDSIVGGGTLAISSATKYQDTVLTGWTSTALVVGDILAYGVKVAAVNITRCTASIKVIKT